MNAFIIQNLLLLLLLIIIINNNNLEFNIKILIKIFLNEVS